MLVHHEVAVRVANLPVPNMDPVGIETEAREMVGVGVDCALDRNAKAAVGAEGIGERRRVIHPELRDFVLRRRPAHDAACVDICAGHVPGPKRRAKAEDEEQGS